MKPGDHVRIRVAQLPEAVGALGRWDSGYDEVGRVRLTTPLIVSTGALVLTVWCKKDDVDVVERTPRHLDIVAAVENDVPTVLDLASIRAAVKTGEITLEEIVDAFSETIRRALL